VSLLRCPSRRALVLGLLLCQAAIGASAGSSEGKAAPDSSVPPADHNCQIFGLVFASGQAQVRVFKTLCRYLYEETFPDPRRSSLDRPGLRRAGDAASRGRAAPSRDGWGFGYFFSPPHLGIDHPMVIRGGPPACEDSVRWNGAIDEIATYGFGGASAVLGHVRKSSYGPDWGALPDPHPFADSLGGRWWLFSHNGHMLPDSVLSWIPAEFLERHPIDYDEVLVDSELFFRYCEYEIARLGTVRDGLLYALHRVKSHDDFLFNICLTSGDTLWTAHTLSYTPFYYAVATPDSTAWWASTAVGGAMLPEMEMDHLYWFTSGGMGSASYE
jgi:predicted glutamine amidotransferase